MNPTTADPPPQLHPPQPPQPHRSSTSCDRHPDEHFTGFCPSCLCERLAVLDHSLSSSTAASSSRKPPLATTSTATAALKAIFKSSGGGTSNNNNSNSSSSSNNRPFLFPELRRTKSFSASKNECFSGVFEPQRKSCDVRARNTLWCLFNQEEERKKAPEIQSSTTTEPRISSSGVRDLVFEQEIEAVEDDKNDHKNGDFVKVLEDPTSNFSARNSNARPIDEIIEEEEEEDDYDDDDGIVIEPEKLREEEEVEELKTMKDHIDLDSQTKKPSSGRDFKEIAGSFWSAASVFSKKLQKWRQKQKLKKRRSGSGPGSATLLPVEKPISRQFRETQSEIADYGFGRRSCDTDPRFSLDAGRISLDDPRYSFDAPRASWDGYLIGRMPFPRMPTMLSVVEDDAPPPHRPPPVNLNNNVVVARSDTHIPVEEPSTASMSSGFSHEDEGLPGGTAQTKEYYSDSSSRRRRSLDRSNSIRKTAAAVVAEIDDLKSVSNAKVSPATTDYFHGSKLVVPDRDSRDSNSNSLRDDCSEAFEMGFREQASVVGNGEQKGAKKSRRWSKAWNIWGFIHRRSVNKDEDEDRYSRANGVERSFSESWQDYRGDQNGDVRGGFNPKMLRSNSSVSWRNSHNLGSFASGRKCNAEATGNGRNRKEEFVLERNRSARYSPNNVDNGPLRFYLTPMKGSRRGGWVKTKSNHAHSIARSVLRLY